MTQLSCCGSLALAADQAKDRQLCRPPRVAHPQSSADAIQGTAALNPKQRLVSPSHTLAAHGILLQMRSGHSIAIDRRGAGYQACQLALHRENANTLPRATSRFIPTSCALQLQHVSRKRLPDPQIKCRLSAMASAFCTCMNEKLSAESSLRMAASAKANAAIAISMQEHARNSVSSTGLEPRRFIIFALRLPSSTVPYGFTATHKGLPAQHTRFYVRHSRAAAIKKT